MNRQDDNADEAAPPDRPTIWVDGDACPVAIKELVFRAAEKREIKVVVVANQSIPIPKSQWVRRITVRDGADMADHAIVAATAHGDIVIADDVPLAARVIEKGAVVITSRGDLYNERNIHNRLATRDLLEQLRLSGVETGGPKAFGKKDAQTFANQLDRTLTKRLK
ncbi:YaiI/YqxD family protein [Stieleria sp. JC731]|uniref:YaiI/YqxD family protein n=1 Tax=Pirellulaceae TaxID=2691357 RepID=UPI001E6347AB|nr:YaiI/YqxD family protein [Stieleria sp. JC731]MCC9603562.1 YaiI/YqxD family protein [Stieleria sp. JC731]